jgi:hypothetical protein
MKTGNFILKFGKYKGQYFESTPQSYQNWLLSQDWFKVPKENEKPMPRISPSWDGYSRKGEAQEWAVFEWEKNQSEKMDCRQGICSCCVNSMYYGI